MVFKGLYMQVASPDVLWTPKKSWYLQIKNVHCKKQSKHNANQKQVKSALKLFGLQQPHLFLTGKLGHQGLQRYT